MEKKKYPLCLGEYDFEKPDCQRQDLEICRICRYITWKKIEPLKRELKKKDEKVEMKIYLAHPVSGYSYEKVAEYFRETAKRLKSIGYGVFYPLIDKGVLRNELKYRAEGYQNPLSTNHAVIERDRWMVQLSDIVFVYLKGVKDVSIGCMMELAWAHLLGKHTIVVMEKENIHNHAFVLEAADIVFENFEEAMFYLEKLKRK